MELNYEEDVRIDPESLDIEWVKQPELMRRYARYSADCKMWVDQAKEKLDFVKAQLDLDIRKNPAYYGLDKVTEGAIQNTILLQDEYKEAEEEYIKAKYEYEISLVAVRALEQKKTALENLVKLLGVSYFAGPKTPRDLNQEYSEYLRNQEQMKKTNKNIKISRKKGSE